MKRRTQILTSVMSVTLVITLTYIAGWLSGQAGQAFNPISEAQAAGGKVKDPAGVAPDRYVYYPGTEALADDEIRVIACGTGMPSARISQASACFVMELGNGDKFIFDLGSGSMRNINSLMIPS
ncbi:MAG: hypothetical protein OET79_03390, partial [Nitrospirota bacterium]|nr:hypothetical protein [Nitrospirota bacterium]